ncbi:hypothetical protein ETAA8_14300 [Anatilimnocola aggregata]|uniref:Glycosyltransferase RgtA/B/C/D-like domain-containing protein n=1 Tax=Anatilimnocola aggregata TaxID=2528021 RepID=A0A517Y881_9BACT|nr:glycosyltransferase family 39 protein [Anatilimnocola aggregata]QDU26352.1 hypothetical protein ETAA8_14300 [Anatilimnocola aggregata]
MSPIAKFAATRLSWQTARRAIVTGLLALHFAVAVGSISNKSITYDEIAHVTAGCAYWQYNDYRLQPENGNLPQRWCALPIVLTGRANLPNVDHAGWKTADVWTLGDAFLFRLGNDARQIIFLGRCFAALWGVGICLIVYCWSRSLFGDAGGLLSLVSCAWCPTLLANAPLMTSDACLTFFLTWCVWLVWQLLHEVTRTRVALASLAIGGLFLAKLSAVLILPIAAILVVARCFQAMPLAVGTGPNQRLLTKFADKAKAIAGVTGVCTLVAFVVVWIAYGARYDAFNPSQLPSGSYYKLKSLETATKFIPPRPRSIIQTLAAHEVLPEPYLYGAAFVVAHRERYSFFQGEYSLKGWKSFFPFCLLVKTPLPMFGLLALAMAALLLKKPPVTTAATESQRLADPNCQPANWAYRLLPVLVLLGVYWVVSLWSSLNIGHRHLLPTYPAMHILVGAAALWLTRPVGKFLVWSLVAWLGIESALVFPHYLAYFNPLVDRQAAHQHLVDSSLDWGQDLPGLQQWLSTHNAAGETQQPVYLAYFGTGSPKYYGIQGRALNRIGRSDIDYLPGIYCVSATTLQAIYEAQPGRWNHEYESRYQDLKQRLASDAEAKQEAPVTPETLGPTKANDKEQNKLSYSRYLRMLAYLRHRQPDDHVGHSILIFRLTEKDIHAALDGPPPELDDRPSLTRGAPQR